MKIGILGGGQLGRMLAMSGLPLDMQFTFLEPNPEACAREVGSQIVLAYDDEDGLQQLGHKCDVVTYEFENVPVNVARDIEKLCPIYPGPEALRVSQDRLTEKRTFQALDIGVTRFAPVATRSELDSALAEVGLPAILKTRRMGYDGKGQYRLKTASDADKAWEAVENKKCILEAFVEFKREISCLGVRSRDGEMVFYPVAENRHHAGILRVSTPHENDPMQLVAEDYTRRMLEKLDYVGTLGFEFFDCGNGQLLANEIAPRVHNSGHWSIEGSHCSQFENHMRAICGMALGDPALRGPCAMVNFISDAPSAKRLVLLHGVHPHLYGKSPRPGRKLGHATVTAPDTDVLVERINKLNAILPPQD